MINIYKAIKIVLDITEIFQCILSQYEYNYIFTKKRKYENKILNVMLAQKILLIPHML